ncbi:MAG: hypothetical protein UW22_C0053G0019 [Candidatus Gottesmanbacteria bacterium GW2011_GWB1_44_11c]|uniref:Uncharacterized protein n=2 Tax=Candidatus Gottesmaniibacteriota TaxID=1752720 RepID=A0A0G1INI5_9BACT|nr:MAG: hypothetical protein UW22_C0053G0019 [Candidatus Gottesmanbacteria bacterium GW2011_GWB1_44_11c]KKT60685.1 MAG: hypothetical protein UW52_C0019G0013 [Candidatus Gottesmanbacteria bacterium GW2011_GWA1_44_24b]
MINGLYQINWSIKILLILLSGIFLIKSTILRIKEKILGLRSYLLLVIVI